tara:strand:+ start:42075 stop:42458 length:384 start_codon:yes stop_codon:yes gene_type:complete
MSDAFGKWCPLIRKNCIEHKCAWYMRIAGLDPNTGQEIDHWGCAISWMPTLLIENSQQQRQTGAAVESFRNEMVNANESNQQMLDAVGNMYLDMCEQQGVNVDQYIEPLEGIDNNEENILPPEEERP